MNLQTHIQVLCSSLQVLPQIAFLHFDRTMPLSIIEGKLGHHSIDIKWLINRLIKWAYVKIVYDHRYWLLVDILTKYYNYLGCFSVRAIDSTNCHRNRNDCKSITTFRSGTKWSSLNCTWKQ